MAALVHLSGRFTNPDGTPALGGGRLTFELVPANIPDTSVPETVTPGPVSTPLLAGAFTVFLRGTDDPELTANVDGPITYKVTRTGMSGAWIVSLPTPGPWDWTDLSPLPAAPDTVVVPVPGPPGPAGPAGTASTSVSVFTYTDETDLRPSTDVCFWIPDPYTLGDPFGALVGDLVLRSTPDVVQGLNGIAKLWQGTPVAYEALPSHDPDTVYFLISP
jgi:hypothetical protein